METRREQPSFFGIGSGSFVINEGSPTRNISFNDGRFTIKIDTEEQQKMKKQETKKVIEYKPGMSIKAYIEKLLKSESDKDRIKWLRTFNNCVLPKPVKEAVDESIIVVLQRKKFEEWGLYEHFEKGLTNSILIYGPPGTGKTMISESIAAVLGKNLMKITTANVQSNVPGETERNITDSFKKAKQQNCVIMFDECDGLLANRNDVGTILAAEINCLLTEIERFDGEVILTTSRLHSLDEALQRRIIAKVKLDLPDKESRELIWQKLIPDKMPVENLDFKKLSQFKLSGGEIKNCVFLSARKAIVNNETKVNMSTFLKVIEQVKDAKIDYEDSKPRFVSNSVMQGLERGC